MIVLIIILPFVFVFFFVKYKIDKEDKEKWLAIHKKIKEKHSDYEVVKCETSLNTNSKYYHELLFNHCKIACDKDSLYIFDNNADPVIVRRKMRKINSTYVQTPTYLNMNSFSNAIHIEFELKDSLIVYTIRIFNVSDAMKQKIQMVLQN